MNACRFPVISAAAVIHVFISYPFANEAPIQATRLPPIRAKVDVGRFPQGNSL